MYNIISLDEHYCDHLPLALSVLLALPLSGKPRFQQDTVNPVKHLTDRLILRQWKWYHCQ